MNSSNIFLQLRQKDAEEVYKNGDFATQLRRPIVLEQGDQIVVNKSIIDSRGANAGKVVLEEDTTIGFHFYYYIVNFDTDQKYSNFARSTLKTQADVDNNYYIACGKESPAGYEVMELTGISYGIIDGAKVKATLTAVLQYTDLGGIQIRHPILLTYNGNIGRYERTNLTLRARRTGNKPPYSVFEDVTDDNVLINAGTDKGQLNLQTQVLPNGVQYFPVINEKSIVMPKGNYTPADFAERFTRLMTLNGTDVEFGGFEGTTNNPLLVSTDDPILTNQNELLFLNMKNGVEYFYYAGTVAPPNPRFVGTNEFELQVDADTNRFKWNYTHFPYYDSGVESVRYNEIGNTNKYQLISSYSGILFHGFFSTQNIDGKQVEIDLWEKQLGFNTSSLSVGASQYINNPSLGVVVPNFGSNPEVGKQVTSGNVGIDVGVVKDTNNGRNVIDLSGNSGLTTNINETEPIFASGDIAATNFDFGYYLLELQGGIQTDLITNNSMKTNIFSVVGRYYENQNYTTGTSADAIIYQHNGATQYLNAMRVRILNSDFNVPDDLGPDCSCFIQHIKAPPAKS
jgi:hypothetical protein